MQRKLIRLFLQTSIPFGLFMMIYDFIAYGISISGILSGVISGVVFGAIMTGVIGYWHIRSVKRKSSDDYENNYNVEQIKEIDLSISYDQAFKLCIESLDQLKKAKVEDKDYSQGWIIAKTGITWDTFGDTISFKLTEQEDCNTNIVISSKPTHFQIADYGKNLDNVNKIISFLEKY